MRDYWQEEKHKEDIKNYATQLIEYNWSLRVLSDNVGISKSTLFDWFHTELSHIDDDLYVQVKNRLYKHKKEIMYHRDRSGKFKAFN